MIFSIWLRVDDPGNKGFPPSISPRIQPRDHMSTPFVYLGINHKQLTLLNVLVSLSLCSQNIIHFYHTCTLLLYVNFIISFKTSMLLWSFKNFWVSLDVVYLWDASRISGALYQRVATYSVKFGSPVSASTPICVKDRASPKSQTFTTHSLSSKILEGCKKPTVNSQLCTIPSWCMSPILSNYNYVENNFNVRY